MEKESISKNFYKGEPITSIDEIAKLADERKAVFVVGWKRVYPASCLLSQQARHLLAWINRKQYFNIKRKPLKWD